MALTAGVLTNFADYMTQIKKFLCGSVSQSYLGTGNGTMTRLDPRPGIVAETWLIVATSATNFTVTGSISGAQAAATVGTEYDNGFIRFLISAGGTAFIATDTFTVVALQSPLSGTLVKTSYTGTGNGLVCRMSASFQTVTETWTLTATSATNFTVTGSVSGAAAAATVGTEYDNGKVRFLIKAGTVAYVATDVYVLDATLLASGGQTWEIIKDSAVRSDFQDVTNGYITGGNTTNATTGPFDRRMYFRSRGLGGTDSIYHCITSFHSSTTFFNVGVATMTAYNSALPLESQSGVIRLKYMLMNNASSANPYRFVANGRRAIHMVRINTVYQSAYTGWLHQNGSPDEFPMPYACGGSHYTYNSVVSTVDDGHRAFFAPAGANTATIGANCTLAVLARDGLNALPVCNYANASAAQGGTTTFVAPLRSLAGIGSATNGASIRKQGYCYGNTDRVPRRSYIVSSLTGFKGCYGDLDGVSYVSGEGLAPEDSLNDVDCDYIVWPSAFYTHREAFAAIRLE